MQNTSYEMEGMAQVNAVLERSNSAVMDKLPQMNKKRIKCRHNSRLFLQLQQIQQDQRGNITVGDAGEI